MAGKTATPTAVRSKCVTCGFTAESGSDTWNRVLVPGLGEMTQCPSCDSTNVITGR